LAMAIKSFAMSLVWIQLWPPLYAILNYVATLASARNLEAAAKMGTVAQGLALETAASIYSGAVSDQAIAGYMVISIPIIATAIIKGGEVAFQAVTGVGAMQSAAASEAGTASKGNISQGTVSTDQQQLAPNRTSAFMETTADAHGATIRGIGLDAGIFRYQATLSRLASTFTFTERQANTLTDSAREAETFARSERDAMQRSQAAALTQALGLQEQYDRSQSRAGGSMTSDGGSTATQVQTLNAISRNVNRRLGLSTDSTVGKGIVAAAAAGISIPLTEIGGLVRREGRQVEQEHLQSAMDYARGAVASSQVSDTQSVMQEFRASQSFQWARSSRVDGSTAFDSSYRQALDHQASSESAYAQSKELGRVAQFMREWSSGAQTDFTNYAARRLAERGLLREEDPITLQRSITEIAYAYAQGGDVTGQFVARDTPLGPSVPLTRTLGWTGSDLRDEFVQTTTGSDAAAVRDRAATNDAAVREEQARRQVSPGAVAGDDVSGTVRRRTADTTGAVARDGASVSREQGTQSEVYNTTVNRNRISRNHGGNRAVWDTVGVQSDNRAGLGTSPEKPRPIRWRMNEHGVPVPNPEAQRSESRTEDSGRKP
ncbi:MAG: conjugal transfer protein TraG N-terminal domain-containing protein, partial [Burkholderiales bacterium]|nr:conjugal transfer protein TraG N-terminal domain-containing protein [Burkholderiales bacterium]